MKLQSFKKLVKTDYAEEFQAFVETLSGSINSGIENLYTALNKRLTLRDNLACTVKDIEVEVNSSGIPKQTLNITTDLDTRVEGIQVIYVLNKTSTTVYVTGTPFISYEITQTGIKVNHIAGLHANNKYLLRLVIWQL